MNLIYRVLQKGRIVFLAPLLVLASSFPGFVTGGKITEPPKSARQSFSDAHLDYKKWNRTKECCTAQGKKVAIASGCSQSSKCGKKVLEGGGNIVDAAVATAFCLAVERPHSVSIGSGGFMLLHLPHSKEKNIFLDFRETRFRQLGLTWKCRGEDCTI